MAAFQYMARLGEAHGDGSKRQRLGAGRHMAAIAVIGQPEFSSRLAAEAGAAAAITARPWPPPSRTDPIA